MIFDRMEQNPGARLLFVLACLVVVVYGIRFARPILLPSSLALFLAVLSLPVTLGLQRRRVPAWLSIAVAVLLNVAVFGLIVLLASRSIPQFQEALPGYVDRFISLQNSWVESIEDRTNFALGSYLATDLFNPRAVVDIATNALGQVAGFLGSTFLVFLIMIFMLSEANVFPDKFRVVLGHETPNGDRFGKIVGEIQTYLGIKTVISLATGLILGFWTLVMGLDFPVLLGLVAFVLNYVPTVGSIIAAAPAIILSLILYGTIGNALGVALGYVVVNIFFGNILEPNLMGRRLGLSTLVVILSLLFWGWAWGPMGALLSVPLTVMVKIWLENTKDLRWIAVLLDKAPPVAMAAAPDLDVEPG